MRSEAFGRVRIALVIMVSVAVPIALLIHGQATAYMDSQAARMAVIKALEALPRAEAMRPEATVGMAATEPQRATLLKAIEAFENLLTEGNYEGAWEFVHPETYGEWDQEDWVEAHEETSQVDLSELLATPFSLMMLGKKFEALEVKTMGAEGWAHVAADIEMPSVVVLRKEGAQWLVDLENTDQVGASKRVAQQLEASKSEGGQGSWLSIMAAGEMLGELIGAYLDPGSVPLHDLKREVTSATVAGNRADVSFVTKGQLHLLLPLKMTGRSWNISWDDGAQVIGPDMDIASLESRVGRATGIAARVECMSNMKQLALAMMMYCQDYDEQFPIADRWCGATYPYTMNEEVYACPADDGDYSYGMNYKLSRLYMGKIEMPAETIMLFESEPSRKDAYDKGGLPGDSLADPPRHVTVNNFAWTDGHVSSLELDEVYFNLYRVVDRFGDDDVDIPAPADEGEAMDEGEADIALPEEDDE